MKKLILISLFSLMFSQTELTTRVFEFNNIEISTANQELDIRGVLEGYGLSNIMISAYDFDSSESSDFSFRLMVSDTDANDEGSFLKIDWRENFLGLVKTLGKNIPFDLNSDDYIFIEQQSYWGSGSPPFYGNLKLAVTGEFSNNLQTQIDDLTAQVNDLIEQLTGCVDCQGDASANGMVNVQDIILLVDHILEVENGDCFTQ